jgi:hypothetical protein
MAECVKQAIRIPILMVRAVLVAGFWWNAQYDLYLWFGSWGPDLLAPP